MSVPDGSGNDRTNAGDGSRRMRKSSQWPFVKWNKKQMSSQSAANDEMKSSGQDHEQPQERDNHEDPTSALEKDDNKTTESGESKATEKGKNKMTEKGETKTTVKDENKKTENDSPNEAEEPFMPSTIETPEQFIKWFLFEVQGDNWAHHEDRITIKCEETMEQFLNIGGLPEARGVRECQKFVEVPVINEQIAHELWKKLASHFKPLTTKGSGNEGADEEPKHPDAFNHEQIRKIVNIKAEQVKRKEAEQKEEQKRLEDFEKAEKKKKKLVLAGDIKGKAVAEDPLVWEKPDACSSSKSRSHPGTDSATEPDGPGDSVETPTSKTKRVLGWLNDRLSSHGEQMAAGQGSLAVPPRARSDPPPGKPRLRKLQIQQAASQRESGAPPLPSARTSNPRTITPHLSAPQEVPKRDTTHADDSSRHQGIHGRSTSTQPGRPRTQASVTQGGL